MNNHSERKNCSSVIVYPRKFTIIELLLVIAVIFLLASLLMPALQSAKNKSREITCANNEKQHGLAIFMFADDNDKRFPPTWILNGPETDVNSFWTGKITSYLGAEQIASHKEYFVKYFRCPSRESKLDNLLHGNSNYSISMHITGREIGTGYYKINKVFSVRNPANTVLVGERLFPAPSGKASSYMVWKTSYGVLYSLDAIHGTRVNILWVDGHVTSERCLDVGYGSYWAL